MKKLAITGLALMLITGLASFALCAEQTVSGTLEDSFCFVTMGAHGASHAKCAAECAKAGIPVALVEKGSDKMYVLLPAKNAEALPADVTSHMEQEVTVTGDAYTKGGISYITVKSLK